MDIYILTQYILSRNKYVLLRLLTDLCYVDDCSVDFPWRGL